MTEISQSSVPLGSCFGRLAEVNHFFARFEPIAMLQDGSWVRLDERKKRFPRNGGVQVTPGELNGHGSVGGFWFFPREALGTPDDRSTAERPARAIPVLDLRHLSIVEARKRILKDGVRLPDHQPRQALVFLADGRYGRFKFERAGTSWVARLPADGAVDLRPIDPAWNVYQHGDEFGYLPFEGETSSPGELIDWTPDREFLSKVLERYRAAVDAYFGLGTKGGDDPAKRLQRALTDARVLGEDARINEASIKRLREGWPAALEALESIREVGDLLLNSDAGKLLLQRTVEAKSQSMVAEIEAEARSGLDESLRTRRDQVQGLDDEIRRLRAEALKLEASRDRIQRAANESDGALRAVNDELAERRRAIGAASDQLTAAERARSAAEAQAADAAIKESLATERVRDLKVELDRMSLELLDAAEAANLVGDERAADLGRRIAVLLGKSEGETALMPIHSPPWGLPLAGDPVEIDLAELPSRLKHEAHFHGLETSDVLLLDGVLRSGELVMLIGPSTELALSAFSRAAAGGRIRSQVLDPSAIGLDDLWRVPGSHRPTVFAMAWNRALQEPETTILLCLRNLDAAPFKLWLRSLRAALASPARPSNLVMVATTVGRGADDEEFPDALALRQDLIAIKARFAKDSHRCDYALGTRPDRPTVLKASGISREPRLSAPPAQLRHAGHAPDTVYRALRLRAVLDEPLASDAALSWASFLTSGRLDDLHDPLREAHAELKELHLQR